MMLSKNQVKYIQTLYHKKFRDAESVFLAEGPKLVNELLHSNFEVMKVYSTVPLHTGKAEVVLIDESDLNKISLLSTPNEMLAIVRQQKPMQEPLLAQKISLVLDGIQDPGNLGTIIRIADWFGVHQIIASKDTVDFYNPKVVQSSMGSITRVNIWYTSLEEWLPALSVPVFGAMLSGENLFTVEKPSEAVLVIGNESQGIREGISSFIQHPLTIPKKGGAESLNAAVATGIILSQLTK